MSESPAERTKRFARERMRRRRAKGGTVADRALVAARRELIRRHRVEYEGLLRQMTVKIAAGKEQR